MGLKSFLSIVHRKGNSANSVSAEPATRIAGCRFTGYVFSFSAPFEGLA
jgi:hypothetical protein